MATARRLNVLTGPTAAGKTEWALRWAEAHNAEIISCDSLLFYRGMDIGTAKPTRDELTRVPHHLIDVCELTDRMDVTRYVELARQAAEEISRREKAILVVGGSGFYLKAFFAPVADEVEVPENLRKEIAVNLEARGLPALVEELRTLNPLGLGTLDVANPRRVIRALERCRASGRTLAELADDFSKQKPPFADWEVRLVRLDCEATRLEERIERRVRAMLDAGLVAEVERLLPAALKENTSAAKAIGYRETIDFIEGRLPKDALAATIAQNTRALVKKQRTWFRTQLPQHRVMSVENGYMAALFEG